MIGVQADAAWREQVVWLLVMVVEEDNVVEEKVEEIFWETPSSLRQCDLSLTRLGLRNLNLKSLAEQTLQNDSRTPCVNLSLPSPAEYLMRRLHDDHDPVFLNLTPRGGEWRVYQEQFSITVVPGRERMSVELECS